MPYPLITTNSGCQRCFASIVIWVRLLYSRGSHLRRSSTHCCKGEGATRVINTPTGGALILFIVFLGRGLGPLELLPFSPSHPGQTHEDRGVGGWGGVGDLLKKIRRRGAQKVAWFCVTGGTQPFLSARNQIYTTPCNHLPMFSYAFVCI